MYSAVINRNLFFEGGLLIHEIGRKEKRKEEGRDLMK